MMTTKATKRFKVRRLLTQAQYCYINATDADTAELLARRDDDEIEWFNGKVSDAKITDCFEVDKNGKEVK